jgi:DNA (cytosine-5)-methyltransferase 1
MNNSRNYVDLFSGCGGLSLGLAKAGWDGLFAIEKDAMAFETLQKNLINSDGPYSHFRQWPTWLPKKNHNIKEFLANSLYRDRLTKLKESVPLMVGGPPCQGFSVGGARREHDERNELVFDYLEAAALVEPDMLMIENVEGMARAFKTALGNQEESVLHTVLEQLGKMGYSAGYFVAKAIDAGVPQDRKRVITLGVKKQLIGNINPAKLLEAGYKKFGTEIRKKHSLSLNRPTSIGEAIDDLSGDEYAQCPDSPKFSTARYLEPNSNYQVLMRMGISDGELPNSHRFSNHGENVLALYEKALRTQKPGRLSKTFLRDNNTKTQKKFLMGKEICASTLTTHPDEHIHYKYPRNVSLREMARLQSFPDDFIFHGRYTLNGERRKLDVSRCAQIGNAIPVLMGQALGLSLNDLYETLFSSAPHEIFLDNLNSCTSAENMELFL